MDPRMAVVTQLLRLRSVLMVLMAQLHAHGDELQESTQLYLGALVMACIRYGQLAMRAVSQPAPERLRIFF